MGKILLIEDNPDDAELIKRALVKYNPKTEVEVVPTGEEGLKRLHEDNYDVVLLDYSLPYMNGLRVLQEIRVKNYDVPVIMVTGRGDERIAVEAVKAGACDYITKSERYLITLPTVVEKSLQNYRLGKEKRKLEQEIKESEEEYRTLFEYAGTAVVVIERDKTLSRVNKKFEELSGYSREEIEGKMKFTHFIAEKEKDRMVGYHEMRRIDQSKVPTHYEFLFIRRNGEERYIDVTVRLIPGTDRSIASLTDITERKILERALIESKKKLQSVFDAITDYISMQLPDLRIVMVNEATAKRFKATYQEIIGRKCYEFYQKRDKPCEGCTIEETIRKKQPTTQEIENPVVGEILRTTFYPILDENGELIGVVEYGKIITEEKKLEKKQREMELELMEKHKLASIGMLAEGIAHNLNTPLTGISGNALLLRESLDELYKGLPERAKLHYEECKKYLERIINQANKMDVIIKNLLYKSRQEQEGGKQLIDINQLLREELQFLEADMRFKHEIRKIYNFDETIQPIEGVYSDFSQSFVNIIRNAMDAMYGQEKQELTITTRQDNDFIYVEIHDTGVGIKEEHIPKIFDPFFTTKPLTAPDGRPTGVGLGLHSCYRLMEPYGVKFEVESKPGDTTFIMKIPKSLCKGGSL